MHLIPTDSKKGDLSRFFIDRCIGLHLYSEGTKTRNQGPMTQWIYYLHLFLFSLGIWSYQIHLQMMPSIKYQYADISSCSRITRGNPPRKSSSPIRAAEYFRPLHSLRVSIQPRKSKRDSNAISSCWENWKLLWQVLIVLHCCVSTVFLSFAFQFGQCCAFSVNFSCALILNLKFTVA